MQKSENSFLNEFFKSITPEKDFDKDLPPEPDYSDQFFWACTPKNKSFESLSPFNKKFKRNKIIDCFYIHPTGFFLKEWNFHIDRDSSTFQRTQLMLSSQASAFYESCNIYAPEYRQATFAAISQNNESNSQQSLEVAYSDIKKAFRFFLTNFSKGKPFIIASHSQGSLHGQRLFHEEEFKKDFNERLLAAYLIGYPLDNSLSDNLDLEIACESADEPSIIQFQTVGEGAVRAKLKYWMFDGDSYSLKEINHLHTTNPISWNTSKEWHESKFESLLMPKLSGPSVFFNYKAVDKNSSSIKNLYLPQNQEIFARVSEKGYLETRGSTIERLLKTDITGKKDLHNWDYQIFWNHIRKNVNTRINNYINKIEN